MGQWGDFLRYNDFRFGGGISLFRVKAWGVLKALADMCSMVARNVFWTAVRRSISLEM